MQALHVLKDTDGAVFTLWATYLTDFVRTGEGWKIARHELVVRGHPGKHPKTLDVSSLTSAFLRKQRRLRAALVAALCQCLSASVGLASEMEPLVVTADRSQECAAALSQGRQQLSVGGLPASFSLLNWNVEKAQHPDLISAFSNFAKRSDLIFLQEAVAAAQNRNRDRAVAV